MVPSYKTLKVAALKSNSKQHDRALKHARRRLFSMRGSLALIKFRSLGLFLLGATLVYAMLPVSAFACPTCKEGLANGHDGVSLGYYWSILFMIAMPFLIFAGWAFFIWRALRKQTSASLDPALES